MGERSIVSTVSVSVSVCDADNHVNSTAGGRQDGAKVTPVCAVERKAHV